MRIKDLSPIDSFPSSQGCAIGLDVGGTKIAGGIVLPSGAYLDKQVIATEPKRGGQPVLDDALRLAEALVAQAKSRGLEVLGIGVGVAELVDLAGNITSSHTIDWRGQPVQAAFSQLAPAVVESDVRAPALAEAVFGAGRPFRIFTYVTVGTGISYSLVIDRRPYAGAQGNALIFASSPLTMTCSHCGALQAPVLEELASGPGLVAGYNRELAKQSGVKDPSGPIRRGEEVMAAVQAGDKRAVSVVKAAGEMLGVSVGWLVNVLDPQAVIVGGGLGTAGGLYWDSFVASTRAHIWSDTNRELPIQTADLGVDAGFIGAATTILQRQLGSQRNAE